MAHGRGLRWFLLLLLLAAIVLGLRTCTGRRGDSDTVPAATGASPPPSAGTATRAATPAVDEEYLARHAAAMRAAVSTLHAYIAALPDDDRARADAFWVDGVPAAGSDEADLRELPSPPRALRVQNRTPKALDSEPVPAAVEIPVELRLHLDGQPMRRYQGWYRLRRAIDGESWLITSAAIDALPPPG